MTLREKLHASLIRAQAEEEVAAEHTNAALIALKSVTTWAQMEQLTGQTRHQLQYRLGKDSSPSISRRLLTKQEKQARKAARVHSPREDPRPGVGPAEAARRLGVSRTTVYNMLEKGEFEVLNNARGGQRIATDQAGSPSLRERT